MRCGAVHWQEVGTGRTCGEVFVRVADRHHALKHAAFAHSGTVVRDLEHPAVGGASPATLCIEALDDLDAEAGRAGLSGIVDDVAEGLGGAVAGFEQRMHLRGQRALSPDAHHLVGHFDGLRERHDLDAQQRRDLCDILTKRHGLMLRGSVEQQPVPGQRLRRACGSTGPGGRSAGGGDHGGAS